MDPDSSSSRVRGDTPDLSVSIACDPAINQALQRNAIPLVRELRITNKGGTEQRDLVVSLRAEPAFAAPLEVRISLLAPGGEFRLAPLDLKLSSDFLAATRERIAGFLQMEITRGETCLVRQAEPMAILPPNEWTGLASLPEILTAFVMPADPAVRRVIDAAAKILQPHPSGASLNGYQDKSRERVWQQIDAIHQAVGRECIQYIDALPSYEAAGHRIRFPSEILEQRVATRLDLALLFAACCEQVGLHPLLFLEEGHAYAGCWLLNRTLPQAAIDDQQAIRKLVELEEICVFDFAPLTSEGSGSLEEAEALGAARLQAGAPFRLAIDVKRARISGIRPLPLAAHDAATAPENPVTTSPPPIQGTPAFSDQDTTAWPSASPPRAPSRIDVWKSRLLDLSLRNRLLNFRATKGTVQILSPHAERLEDELAADANLTLAPRPKMMASDDPWDPSLVSRQQHPDKLADYLHEELRQRRLHTRLDDNEHQARLTDLYRSARLAMEENGTNTLYVAVGVLEWRETQHSERTLRAPLLLIPVELKRRSIMEGFHLRRIDEDTRLNVTLMEMLRQHFQKEIAGLDPLPEDSNGVDVAGVFRLFREAVRDLPGWEVKSEVWLGQFSFTKFLLWQDLADRLEELSRNRVVRHLIEGGGAPFPNPPQDILPAELDERFHPSEIFCPRSADSSQLAAVMAAAAGHDFVLEGPPGTGKSQTITNIIAHCLAQGKRILFVAEKRAALDVVHRRLKEEGLSPFCFELHSNKSGKADVLAQFQESLTFATQQSVEAWTHEAEQLERAREDLNDYVRALHGLQPCGLSAYHCIDHLLPRIAAPLVSLPYIDFLKCPVERVEQCRQAARQLTHRAQLVGDVGAHPLRLVRATDWSPDWSDRVLGLLQTIAKWAPAVHQSAGELRVWLGRRSPTPNRTELLALRGVTDALLCPRRVAPAFVTTSWNQILPELDRWAELGVERVQLRQALSTYPEKRLLALDLDALQRRWHQAQSASFATKWIRTLLIRRQLSAVHETGLTPETQQISAILTHAIRLREINQVFATTTQIGAALLGPLWHNGEPNPDVVSELRVWGRDLHSCINVLAAGNAADLQHLRGELSAPFASDVGAFLASGPRGEQLEAFARDWDALTLAFNSLGTATTLERTSIDSATDHLGALSQVAADIRRGWPDIRLWCAWQRARLEAEQYGLETLCLAVEDGVITTDDAQGCFERSFRRGLLSAIIGRDDRLRHFFGQEHQAKIHEFRQLDERLRHLTRDLVRARLATDIPRDGADEGVSKTEIGLLKKEIGKRARHLPVRQLLSRIPTLMPRLKPCVLMSPLSVAQYLDAGYEQFDLVVFDEASQIPVWDAVGAIARGRQLIVVGDPKQLPPTNFFNRSEEIADDDVVAEFEDLESILDELLSSGVQHKRLQWHYRSRHEGLIAFSNRHYYANDLLTFPSPEVNYSGVRFHLIDARYDQGRSRTNPGEAEALVMELVRRLRDPELGTRSFGVVTFSQAQQQLVENLLDDQRRRHPEIECHFGDEPPVEGEPVFVKNLENVQGDERDVILFSICYGPNEAGRISMNFGPLNRDGGERRLNVAITRAKQEVVVFSSLRSEQIDLTRTRARGVRDLKYFLEYSERGARALAAPIIRNTAPVEDSDFEQFIATRLRAQGHDVHRHVGCSDYRIDLAIVDPAAPDRYLLGIECDGRSYRDAATARDRDKLRQSVLEGLGWKLIRLWSTDWWHDPAGETKKLKEALAASRPAAPKNS